MLTGSALSSLANATYKNCPLPGSMLPVDATDPKDESVELATASASYVSSNSARIAANHDNVSLVIVIVIVALAFALQDQIHAELPVDESWRDASRFHVLPSLSAIVTFGGVVLARFHTVAATTTGLPAVTVIDTWC